MQTSLSFPHSHATVEHRRLCEAMARRVGQAITVESAAAIIREALTLQPQQALPQLLPQNPTREQIQRLEDEMIAREQQGDGAVLDTWHHHADGLVSRTIFIPAGSALTGAEHRFEHLNVCHGDITVWTEEGMKRLTGYHVLPSLPHAKRVGYAHADTWWTTVHANPGNELDIEKLEDALVVSEQLQSRRAALPHIVREKLP